MRLMIANLSTYVLLVASLSLTSCATIFTGSTDDISFRSDPPGATIYIEGLEQGTTPATVTVKRPGFGETEVVLELDGYEDKVFTLQSEFNAVSILNFAGLVGWAIDIATGAVKKYNPKGYRLDLEPESSSFLIDDLPRDAKGSILLPEEMDAILVTDSNTGLTYVFEK